MNAEVLIPDWPAPHGVRALVTTRGCDDGRSVAAYARFNLAPHVGDDPARVAANRQRLRAAPFCVPDEPRWLSQVHGIRVLEAAQVEAGSEADACVAHAPGEANDVCAVLTADCLPLLLCADDASAVGAAHAGWRGLAAGVIETTVAAMRVEPARLMAWLGPAIGPAVYEVGDEVHAAFVERDPAAAAAFAARAQGKWLCDLYTLARQRLAKAGVTRVFGGDRCTFTETHAFYSHRRDGVTGRMATLIWIETPGGQGGSEAAALARD